MTVSAPHLGCSHEPGGPTGWEGHGGGVDTLTALLTLLLSSQPQRVCCAEAHRHQQKVLHQLQAVVPEENLWQVNVSICNSQDHQPPRKLGFVSSSCRPPQTWASLLKGQAASGAWKMRVQTCQGAVCLGVAVLVSWPVLFCIFKAPDKTWIHFSGLI